MSRVSETTVDVEHGGRSAGVGNEARFQIDVEFPDGFSLAPDQLRSVRPGMSITADIVHGHGTLLDWFLDPIRRARTRL